MNKKRLNEERLSILSKIKIILFSVSLCKIKQFTEFNIYLDLKYRKIIEYIFKLEQYNFHIFKKLKKINFFPKRVK